MHVCEIGRRNKGYITHNLYLIIGMEYALSKKTRKATMNTIYIGH